MEIDSPPRSLTAAAAGGMVTSTPVSSASRAGKRLNGTKRMEREMLNANNSFPSDDSFPANNSFSAHHSTPDKESFSANDSFEDFIPTIPASKKTNMSLSHQVLEKDRFTVRDDDLELAIGLSVSHEIQRRESSIIVSTQEYQEDERRRREIFNHDNIVLNSVSDIFAEGNTQLNNTDEVERDIANKDIFDEEDDEEEADEDLPLSQYVPYGIRMEREAVEKKKKRNRQELFENDEIETFEEDMCGKDTSKELSNSPDYTMRPMYIGDNTDTIMMPQSRSTYVGIRPQPTVIMKSKFDVVSDTSHSRIIHNYSDPSPVGRDFTR